VSIRRSSGAFAWVSGSRVGIRSARTDAADEAGLADPQLPALPVLLGVGRDVELDVDVRPPAARIQRQAELALHRVVRRLGRDEHGAREVLLAGGSRCSVTRGRGRPRASRAARGPPTPARAVRRAAAPVRARRSGRGGASGAGSASA
jgi:hypothetical protein